MDVLAKSGVKPVWIERSLRIKAAEKRLLERVEGEWAKVVLEAWEEGKGEGLLGYLGPVGRHATGTVTPRGGWR